MANFQINTITGKDSKRGTSFVGVTTVSSTGAMRIPSGSSAYRGNGGRGIFASGWEPGSVKNIDFINIASTGDGTDFGDLNNAIDYIGSCASATRGVFAGGQTPTKLNTIEYVTIATTGNATDFGGLLAAGTGFTAVSDTNGGLG